MDVLYYFDSSSGEEQRIPASFYADAIKPEYMPMFGQAIQVFLLVLAHQEMGPIGLVLRQYHLGVYYRIGLFAFEGGEKYFYPSLGAMRSYPSSTQSGYDMGGGMKIFSPLGYPSNWRYTQQPPQQPTHHFAAFRVNGHASMTNPNLLLSNAGGGCGRRSMANLHEGTYQPPSASQTYQPHSGLQTYQPPSDLQTYHPHLGLQTYCPHPDLQTYYPYLGLQTYGRQSTAPSSHQYGEMSESEVERRSEACKQWLQEGRVETIKTI